MPKVRHSLSRYSQEAVVLLGRLIREARLERRMTLDALAQRAGVSRSLVQRVEAGDGGCAIGAVFELAAIVGVPLFSPDPMVTRLAAASVEKSLQLLPRSARPRTRAVNDDF